MNDSITYICLYNNIEQVNSFLVPTFKMLEESNRKFKLFLIDCKEYGYKCAAEAFNKTLKEKWEEIDEIVCFIHQDIKFPNTLFHDRICSELIQDDNQILGVAGIKNGETPCGNVKYLRTNEYIAKRTIEGNGKYLVETLDECCFATSKRILSKISFDSKHCFHWHLYGHDLCYQASLQLGSKIYVLPESIFHKNDESIGLCVDSYFIKTLMRLLLKYYGKLDFFCSTCVFSTEVSICGYFKLFRRLIHLYRLSAKKRF